MTLHRFLTHARARNIAENEWGRGGTHSYRTNRAGAFYFSCSGHGGFVIDAAALTPHERQLMDTQLTMVKGTAFADRTGRIRKVAHDMMRRTVRYQAHWDHLPIGFYLAEEDCDWSIPAIHAGILAHHHKMTPEELLQHAKEVHARWYPNSPQVHGSASATGSASSCSASC